ncbi:MAG TPA: HAMP domain-containing sensor histidine kinase [Solirubrobacterales bacterium]|nr:HAMP domain-containing sensor histidine kinase [Solirubrobacterales bacterium]
MPLAVSLRDRVDSEVKGQARSQADVVAASASELLEPAQRRGLRRLVNVSADSVRGRVIVVNRRGRLLADSAGAPPGAYYGDRPEVRAALRGRGEQITRNSTTLGTEILATSAPVLSHGRPDGAVRVTQSVAAVNRAVRTSILDLAALAAVVLLLGLAAGAVVAQRIARPIRRLDRAARQVAAGELETSVAVEGSTEQRSLARAFNEMTQRITRLLGSQRDFVADASHQLRTPLTGLRLRLEALAERFRGRDGESAELEAALTEIDRLALIVDELLVLSRAGAHELPPEQVDLRDAAARAAERLRGTAAERSIELRAGATGGEPAHAWCAVHDLDRSLDALLENAVRYSPAGSEVRVEARPGRVDVLDRGPGLAAGEEEAVFERFSRGSAGRSGPGGTGLGLPIARELIRQWGGEVTLSPREGGGTRATIELPPKEGS